MMYDANLLIEELFKKNFRNKKIIHASPIKARKPLDQIDTLSIRKSTTSNNPIFITVSSDLSKETRRKTRMLFNEVIYNSTKHFFDTNPKAIEQKRFIRLFSEDFNSYKKSFLREHPQSSFINFTNKVPKKETPFDKSRNKKKAYRSLVEKKIKINTTTELLPNETLRPLSTYTRITKMRPSSKINNKIKLQMKHPCIYFNNINLQKHQRIMLRLSTV